MSNPIAPISNFNFADGMKESFSGAEASGEGSFASFLGRSVNQVDQMLKAADRKSTELAVGKTENLHEAMITVEKAETALKLMMQVRNKALEAYHEVMRMQV